MEIIDIIINLEKELHEPTVRESDDKFNLLLSDEYMEIGASGKIYNKKQAIDMLTRSKLISIHANDFKLNIVTPQLIQLVYRAKEVKNITESRNTIRSSIWEKQGEKWKMIFHQGTISNENN